MSPRTQQLINQFGAAGIALGERRALDNGQPAPARPSRAQRDFDAAKTRLEANLATLVPNIVGPIDDDPFSDFPGSRSKTSPAELAELL